MMLQHDVACCSLSEARCDCFRPTWTRRAASTPPSCARLTLDHCAPSVSPRGMQAEVDAVIHTAAVVDMTSNDDQTGRYKK